MNWKRAMDTVETDKAPSQAGTMPGVGRCRFKTENHECRQPYYSDSNIKHRVPSEVLPQARKGGRGLCGRHLAMVNGFVKAGTVTWAQIDAEWPPIPIDADPPPPPPRNPNFADLFRDAEPEPVRAFQDERREWEPFIVDLLKSQGHRVWKLNPSGGSKGAPDLLIITKDGEVLFRELKLDGEELTTDQREFLQALHIHPRFRGCWQPSHLHNGTIQSDLTPYFS